MEKKKKKTRVAAWACVLGEKSLETPQVNEIQSFVVREQSDGTDNDFLISSVSNDVYTGVCLRTEGGGGRGVTPFPSSSACAQKPKKNN